MSEEKQTIEIVEPVKNQEKEVATIEHAEQNNWSEKEIKKAEELGLIKKEETKKKAVDNKVAEVKEEAKPEAKPEEKKEDKFKRVPSYDLTPEQEREFVRVFPTGSNVNGLYFGMKSQRARAQAAEMEKEKALLEMKYRDQQINDLKERLSKVEKPVVDENGESVDPEDKPLTARQLRELQAKEAEERTKTQNAREEKAQKIHEAIKIQEDYTKSVYQDFDDVVSLGADLIKNIDQLEGPIRKKVFDLKKRIILAAQNADSLTDDDLTAAELGYELGMLHPDYKSGNGQKADTNQNGSPAERKNGSLTPEQVKRIEANTSRRGSSASVSGGGGRRVVSVEDITVEDAVMMARNDPQAYEKFRKEHPEKLKALLRG